MWCSEGHGEDTSPVRMEDSHAICFACFLTSDDSLLSLSSSVHYAYSGSSDMSEAWVNEPNGSEPRRMSPVSCFDRFHLIQRAGGGWVWRGKERGTSDWHTHLTTILTAASWFRLFLTSSPSLAEYIIIGITIVDDSFHSNPLISYLGSWGKSRPTTSFLCSWGSLARLASQTWREVRREWHGGCKVRKGPKVAKFLDR